LDGPHIEHHDHPKAQVVRRDAFAGGSFFVTESSPNKDCFSAVIA
jgi:hypothetical protein